MTTIKRLKVPEEQPVTQELTDSQKYQILLQYSEGTPVTVIAKSVSGDTRIISGLIQKTLKNMQIIRETNDLVAGTHTAALKLQQGKTPTKFLTRDFIAAVETQAEVYAYYYAQTGDNRFSLTESGLAMGLPKSVRKATKEYVYRIRGQFLQNLAPVRSIIKEEQDRRIKEYNLEKPQVQMELVNQIEQLKEVVAYEPRQRANLLKAIEMLGRSIGAFTDRIETSETDSRSGLEILMAKAKGEVYEQEGK